MAHSYPAESSARRLPAAAAAVALALTAAAPLHAQVTLTGQVVTIDALATICDQASNGLYHVRRANPAPAIDGRTNDWAGVPAIGLDRREQAKGKWDGPADLTGALRMQWDERALYFCLTVSDDVHSARAPLPKKFPWDAEGWWANDGVQLAFDAWMNGPRARYEAGWPKDGYDEDELVFCVSDDSHGPVVASYRQRGDTRDTERLLAGADVRMSTEADGLRVYEWALPWSQLDPVSPWILGRCGFSFALNDNDGKGFEGGLMWTRGVTFGPDASKLGQIVFDGAAGSRGALLALRPEAKLLAGSPGSRWLDIAGVAPHDTARLLVRHTGPDPVEATLRVLRPGQTEPVAQGRLTGQAGADAADAFAWDLSGLPNGCYDLSFDVAGATPAASVRVAYRQWSSRGVAALPARRDELRKRYALDAAWDSMADAPALIRRHRGMVAAILQWLDPADAARAVAATSGPEGREFAAEERLKALSDGAEMIAALDAGQDYLGKRRNEFWDAYYSPADGRGQHFVMRVPADLDPDAAYPLVVWLHGSNGRPAPDADYVHSNRFIEVRPWGRGDNSFTGLGEDDVFRVMQHARTWYRIDPARIYVTGRSMGGSGTWGMAARNPDVFAAAAPICGVAYELPLENLRSVPLLNQHGLEDWVLSVDHSRFAVSRAMQLGCPVIHREIPDWGHELTTAPPLTPAYEWLLSHRLDERPASVSYTCDTPDRGRCHWLTVREFDDPHERARVEARVSGAGPAQTIGVTATNVGVLELDISRMPVARDAGLSIQADAAALSVRAPLPDRLFMIHQGGAWTCTNQWAPPAAPVRPYRAGGAADLYTGEPLLVVYGTPLDTNRAALLRAAADRAAATAWSSHTINGRFPIKADRDVTAADLKRFNLILIGSARENSLVERMAEWLPFTVNASNELVVADREPVSLDGAVLRLACYNPLSPDRLIFLIAPDPDTPAGDSWLAGLRLMITGLNGERRTDQPDLVVQSLPSSTNGVHAGGTRRMMQFTTGWRWRAIPGGDVRLPPALAGSHAVQEAMLRVIRRTAAADFALGYSGPADEPQYDPRWFTLADMATAREPGPTLLCRMSARDLTAIQRRWVASNEVAVVPALEPAALDSNRTYRVAMQPWLCGLLGKGLKQNLQGVEAGPEWRSEDLWAELFGSGTAGR